MRELAVVLQSIVGCEYPVLDYLIIGMLRGIPTNWYCMTINANSDNYSMNSKSLTASPATEACVKELTSTSPYPESLVVGCVKGYQGGCPGYEFVVDVDV